MGMLQKRIFPWEQVLELEGFKVTKEETDSQSSPHAPKVIVLKVTGLLDVSILPYFTLLLTGYLSHLSRFREVGDVTLEN